MSKKIKKFFIHNCTFIIVFTLLVAPVFSFAAEPLVPCLTEANPGSCDFNAFMTLINKVIRFILFYMAIPIAAIMFVYAGFLMLVPGSESASKKTKGKEIFWNAFIGLILAAAAWLIIRTILLILGYPGDWIGF